MSFHDELGHLPVVAHHDGGDPGKMGFRCGRSEKRQAPQVRCYDRGTVGFRNLMPSSPRTHPRSRHV